MSMGKVKYIVTEEKPVGDIIKNIKELEEKAVGELDPMIYRE